MTSYHGFISLRLKDKPGATVAPAGQRCSAHVVASSHASISIFRGMRLCCNEWLMPTSGPGPQASKPNGRTSIATDSGNPNERRVRAGRGRLAAVAGFILIAWNRLTSASGKDMTLILSNDDVEKLLTMRDCIDVMEE